MCRINTKVVSSVEISGWEAHDPPYFKPLVETTARRFRVHEVSADKAYPSRKNLAAVEAAGGTPYIPFKENTAAPSLDEESMWAKMYHQYAFNREAFLGHYHKRSNAETAFSMIKGKFGDAVRSKSDTAQVNEVLRKVLCHNICVVAMAGHELGIDTTFPLKAQAG